MIELAVAMVLLLFLAAIVLPIAALITAHSASRQVRELEARLDRLVGGPPATATARDAAPVASPVAGTAVDSRQEAIGATAAPAEAGPGAPAPAPRPPAGRPEPSAPAPAERPPRAELVLPSPAPRRSSPPAPGASLEERIALVWFGRLGALAVVVGAAYGYKVLVDNGVIGPVGRVLLGAVLGLSALGIGQLLRRRTNPVYVALILGLGLSLLYLAAYASYGFYHLLPVPAAFAAIAIVTLLGGALAIEHRAEAILVLALTGGFLCPVLLSTGEDRPLALFGYLLVLTALALLVALRMGFRSVVWLAMAGVALLFAAWYGTFWDVRPPPSPPSLYPREFLHGGAYEPLSQRVVPLLAVTAFLLEWLLFYWRARRDRARFHPVALLTTALMLGHAGFTALLVDRPLWLGVALVVLGIVSIALLELEQRPDLLVAPLGASFAAFLLGARQPPAGELRGVLAVLFCWGAVYSAGILRGPPGRKNRFDALTLGLVGGVGVMLALVSAELLLRGHPDLFGWVLVLLSLCFAALAVASEVPLVGLIAAGLTLLGLLHSAPMGRRTDHRFIAVAAVWAAVYLASAAYELVWKRRAPEARRLLTASAAGLGFLLVALPRTTSKEWLLRALLLAAVALADLALGAAILRRGERRQASLLLGQALALLAAAVACLFSGFAITLIWAALAAVVIWLAADSGDVQWLAAGLLLFLAVLVRLAGYDVPEPERLRDLYFSTLGHSGLLRTPLLLNPRACALVGSAAAMFVSARAAAGKPGPFRIAAALLVSLGHLLLLTSLLTEVRDAVVRIPLVPEGVGFREFRAFQNSYLHAVRDQAGRVSMAVTFVLGAYAAALVGIGFAARDRLHRVLGLGLFAIALLKLGVWDVWQLERLYKTIVLVGMGVLLLSASFLYARFGPRLAALLRDGTAAPMVLLLLLGGVTALAPRPSNPAAFLSAGHCRVTAHPRAAER